MENHDFCFSAILAPSLIEWVDYRCRAEFIRPTAIITIGDKEDTMPYDACRIGRMNSTLQCWSYFSR